MLIYWGFPFLQWWKAIREIGEGCSGGLRISNLLSAVVRIGLMVLLIARRTPPLCLLRFKARISLFSLFIWRLKAVTIEPFTHIVSLNDYKHISHYKARVYTLCLHTKVPEPIRNLELNRKWGNVFIRAILSTALPRRKIREAWNIMGETTLKAASLKYAPFT